jgi:hypothetical protein
MERGLRARHVSVKERARAPAPSDCFHMPDHERCCRLVTRRLRTDCLTTKALLRAAHRPLALPPNTLRTAALKLHLMKSEVPGDRTNRQNR